MSYGRLRSHSGCLLSSDPSPPRDLCRLTTMRVTGPLLKVLQVLLEDPSNEIYGLELVRMTGLKSGTLYPLLDRLEGDGLVSSRWEDSAPTELGRPRRRLYRLTGHGSHEARQTLLEHGVGDVRWA